MDHATCANCEAPLTGPYCSQCGQHAHESSRSVGALFHDAWHVVTHVDGRFWQTLAALLWRPGRLTREYFAEHRARYLPPVRLYLVLSLLCFAVAATGSHVSPAFTKNGKGWQYNMVPPEKGKSLDKLDRAEKASKPAAPTATDPDVESVERDVRAAVKEAQATGAPVVASDDGKTLMMNDVDCERWHSDWKPLEHSLQEVCRRNVGDNFKGLIGAFVASIPKMMFVFLPLMAFVMMLMYWWPRHYYVEHLVFFIHTHAAIFLIILIELLLSRLALVVPGLGAVLGYLKGFAALYVVWYVFRAMRVYYGQGRWLTAAKMVVLALSYVIFLFITLAMTFVVVALLT